MNKLPHERLNNPIPPHSRQNRVHNLNMINNHPESGGGFNFASLLPLLAFL